jgi:hypothetical protein
MRTALVTVLAALVITPTPASAATPLPVGESKGVKIERRHGTIVVTFTKRAAKLYRRLAGKRVGIWCTTLPDPDDIGIVGSGSGGSSYRLPKRRRPIETGDASRNIDFCRIWRPAHKLGAHRAVARRLIVSVPLTQRGAVYLDELERAAGMLGLLTLAAEVGGAEKNTYATHSRLVAWIERKSGSPPRKLVELAQPSETPPAGSYGYYSDGVLHAAVVTLSAAGRRLFIEVATDHVVSTNIAEYLGGGVD